MGLDELQQLPNLIAVLYLVFRKYLEQEDSSTKELKDDLKSLDKQLNRLADKVTTLEEDIEILNRRYKR